MTENEVIEYTLKTYSYIKHTIKPVYKDHTKKKGVFILGSNCVKIDH